MNIGCENTVNIFHGPCYKVQLYKRQQRKKNVNGDMSPLSNEATEYIVSISGTHL